MDLNTYDYVFSSQNLSVAENDQFLINSLQNFDPEFSKEKITRDAFGKPYIIHNPFYFSLSHSNDLLVIACSSSPIGIDCEFHKERKFEAIRNRYYTDEEQIFAKNSIENFYQVWCQKEALLKTIGIGIRIDLKSLNSFSYQPDFEFNHKLYSFAPLLTHIHLMDNYTVVINHTKPLKII
ncbi:MAG: 4'-phosphopantetheinyl transferase superfamily protein [Erysipelothrix sp.]